MPDSPFIIACPSCGQPVARSAHRCGRCGGVVKSRMSNPLALIAVWTAIAVFLVILLDWRFSSLFG